MASPTPGFVKNMIRRSLREVVDPSPTKKEEQKIWDFFISECAYCGKHLKKNYKEGHIDHLTPASLGGSNDISNRVLSCPSCNEKEKLKMPWKKFLIQKNPDEKVESLRREKIIKWQRMNQRPALHKNTLDKIESLSNEVAEFYDKRLVLAKKIRNH
ncbi:MAG TPA: HNH endonuclease [Nitrospiria bacterium]|nr:HNH endonuclease [Nitrospiria bacterium]